MHRPIGLPHVGQAYQVLAEVDLNAVADSLRLADEPANIQPDEIKSIYENEL